MTTKKTIVLSIGTICASGLLAAAHTAQAQDAPIQGPVQRIEVTGSSIKRTDAEGAASIQILSRKDIESSGKTSIADVVRSIAADNNGSVSASFTNGFAGSASGVSLRGLSVSSTLVLINGRRTAPYGFGDDGQRSFVDLNSIPLDAVERIEVLKDGASAIYGSDAIAGVVNVILRREYQGTTARASYGQAQGGDGRDMVASVTHGFGSLANDRYNVLFNLEYGKKDEIWYRDRANRGDIGRIDLRPLGFSAQEALGGTGAITSNNAAGSAINGNVRNPATLDYYNRGNLAGAGFTRTFPGAACGNFTNHPQGDPGGG